MATPTAAAAQSSKVPSLAEQAEQKVFEELAQQVQYEGENSVFAVGGSIPLTSFDKHLICESDDTESDEDNEPSDQPSSEPSLGSPPSRDGLVGYDNSSESDLEHLAPPAPGGSVEEHKMRCDPITIRWDSTGAVGGSHKVTLPCTDSQRPSFEQLLKDCQPASFGRAGKDVMDETYRKAGKLDESDFCTNFNPYSLGIIATAAQALAPNNWRQTNENHGVRAELYKLNVYAAPSGKFKAHVDTPRSKHQIGSLVVCLPSVHEGGQLVLRHQGREEVFDWSGEKGSNSIQWAAFYSDCEHEVLEVTAGERVTLTYNLYVTCSANTALIDPEQVGLYHTLKTLLEQPSFCKNGLLLGYHCAHAYAHTSGDTIAALPATLKGVDKIVYTCLAATKLPIRLRHSLAIYKSERLWYYMNLLDVYGRKDTDRFDDLKRFYRREDTEGGHGRVFTNWQPLHKNQNVALDVLSEGLEPWKATDSGMSEGLESTYILSDWARDFSVRQVKWLNKPGHREMALVHGAYGNEPTIGTKYARMVITMDIPPFQDR
ncbi:oxidoreductase, 2OG-Fe(II) oxygenase family protein [Fonsecaea pedrosoi]|nr:oxidoreductase, 2OG-Fe(II) oxygenase family protein [Fonsecaea pedrosoi]